MITKEFLSMLSLYGCVCCAMQKRAFPTVDIKYSGPIVITICWCNHLDPSVESFRIIIGETIRIFLTFWKGVIWKGVKA